VVPGSRMSVVLTCDHRILYGAPAAVFLARVRQLLEQPLYLLV
jgi:pyruvate dehydrogenase E2 component (dihydrolipoamide acetyltransferase)